MTDKKKTIFFILFLLGCVYFLLFWFPNATGARDQNMISVFSSDEFAQYPHAIRMLEPGKTFSQSLYRFFAYQHYYYGFPFYFYSAVVAILPIKLLFGLGSVSINMLMLRELVSVLPMIAALMILVYLQTKFESYPKSILLFLLLLSVPEVVVNDLWWHPESLVFLFIVLTFFFLTCDDLSFQKNFYLAALFCGLAVGTKLIGLFFFLTIPTYVFLGWHQKMIDFRRAVFAAFFFIAIMAITFVLSNPFLFWASERAQALKIQTNQSQAMSAGFVVAYQNGPLSWLPIINSLYGLPVFLLLSIAALVISMLVGKKRTLNLLISTWAFPFAFYLFLAIVIRPRHFFLPILLPIFSAIPAYFTFLTPPRPIQLTIPWIKQNSLRLLFLLVGIVIVGWQFVYNINFDISQYKGVLNRESNNLALRFYSRLDQTDLTRIPLNRPLVIYRDVQIYVPVQSNVNVKFQWGIVGYSYLQKINADVLLFSKQHLRDYTQPNQTMLDPNFADAVHLYKDALTGQVQGYTLMYQDDFGMAYISTPLYDQYFSTH